jgi:hypothetical protein
MNTHNNSDIIIPQEMAEHLDNIATRDPKNSFDQELIDSYRDSLGLSSPIIPESTPDSNNKLRKRLRRTVAAVLLAAGAVVSFVAISGQLDDDRILNPTPAPSGYELPPDSNIVDSSGHTINLPGTE